MDWPDSFYELKRGEGRPMCEDGPPEETEYGARFPAGELADAYLQKETQPTRNEAAALRA